MTTTAPDDSGVADDRPLDRLGRPLRDLRISVTDRCNFRCSYCMPREVFGPDYTFLPRSEILTFEEITRVARIAASLGVQKFRLTGGEPLLRSGLPGLIRMLTEIPHVDIALTTNGSLLAAQAPALAAAGLRRITVSLDSLDDEIFRAMNDADFGVSTVLEGIAAASAAGLPVKVNAVVRRGLNEHTVVDLARWARDHGHIVRFIEYMDVGHSNGWRLDDVVPGEEIVRLISAEMPLEPADPNYRGEVAQRWHYAGAAEGQGAARSASSLPSPSPSAATARAPASPPTATSTPASSPPPAPTSASNCAPAPPTTTLHTPSRRSGSPAKTATPNYARQNTIPSRRSRCPTSAANPLCHSERSEESCNNGRRSRRRQRGASRGQTHAADDVRQRTRRNGRTGDRGQPGTCTGTRAASTASS